MSVVRAREHVLGAYARESWWVLCVPARVLGMRIHPPRTVRNTIARCESSQPNACACVFIHGRRDARVRLRAFVNE